MYDEDLFIFFVETPCVGSLIIRLDPKFDF